MRVLGPIQTETSESFTDSLLAFSVSYRRAWYGLGNGFRLITQRSVVQIHPPQPNLPFGFNGLSQSHNWLGGSNTELPSPNFRISLRTVLRNPCERHPFRHFRPTSALQLGITIWVGHAAVARLRIAAALRRFV